MLLIRFRTDWKKIIPLTASANLLNSTELQPVKFALAQIPFSAHVLVAVPTEEHQIDVSQRVSRNSA